MKKIKMLAQAGKIFQPEASHDLGETFHIFNPDITKAPSKKKLGKLRCDIFDNGFFEYSKDNGLRFRTSSDDDSGKMICSDVPYAEVKCYEYDLAGERKSSLQWGVHNSEATEVRSDVAELQNEKYLLSHLPHCVIVTSPKYLRCFLQLQSKYVPTVNLYNYAGFIPDKFEYVHSAGIVSERKNRNSRSNLAKGDERTLRYYKMKSEDIVSNIDKILKLSPVMALMLAYNLLSLTYSKFGREKPCFIFLLYGDSGTFKSTISLYMFGIFEEYYDNPPINLKVTTLAGIHNCFSRNRDCVMLADDGAPSRDGNDEMCRKIESISRAYGDGTGRTVMRSVTKTHNTRPEGLCAVTAEFQPLRDTSDMARSVVYELKKGEIDDEELRAVSENKHAYIRFITDYIGWICTQQEDYMKRLQEFYHEGRESYSDLGKIHKRLPWNFGWLYAGFKMFLEFMGENYDVPNKLQKRWSEMFEKAVKAASKTHKSEMKKVDEAKLFISTMNKMLRTKQIHIATIYKGENNQKIADIQQNTVGYNDNKYVYILMDEAYALTSKWLNSIDSGYALPKEALQSRLVNEGYVKTSESNRHKSKITVNGDRIQVLKFEKNIFGK